jgi:hypothetical protein
LPAKKQPLKAKLKSWQLTVAVASSVSLIAAGVGVFAYQSYTQAQAAAEASAESSIELGEQRFKELSDLIDDLELAIRNSEETVVNTEGQTLEEQERDDLVAEIEKSKEIWIEQKTKLLELEAAVKSLKSQLASDAPSREALILLTTKVTEIVNSDWGPITRQVVALAERIGSVETAQGQWKNEQDRIAAERAAAAAAAKAAADNLARQSTEPTGIIISTPTSAPLACEITPLESSPEKQRIESIVFGLASNTKTTWACGICAPGTICGRALLPNLSSIYPGFVGPPQNEADALVVVVLDENHINLYLSEDGISILVHEAAHARQHLKYGTLLLSSNAGYLGLPEGYTREQAIAAVEYMADCATIVKFRRSTGAYTSQCTDSQLAAAATLW